MPIRYTNRKQKQYTLYQKPTKKGNLRYYFSQKSSEGATPVENIPAGYEIYENVNGQVFLRKIKPSPILREERDLIDDAMRQYGKVKHYQIDVKGKRLIVYTPVANVDAILAMLNRFTVSQARVDTLLQRTRWRDVMRFELVDPIARTFQTQRYNFLGRIDDWINIGSAGELADLTKRYVPHIEQESYFTLY